MGWKCVKKLKNSRRLKSHQNFWRWNGKILGEIRTLVVGSWKKVENTTICLWCCKKESPTFLRDEMKIWRRVSVKEVTKEIFRSKCAVMNFSQNMLWLVIWFDCKSVKSASAHWQLKVGLMVVFNTNAFSVNWLWIDVIRGHPFITSTRRGEGVRLMWTGGGGPASCGRPHRKLKLMEQWTQLEILWLCRMLCCFTLKRCDLEERLLVT